MIVSKETTPYANRVLIHSLKSTQLSTLSYLNSCLKTNLIKIKKLYENRCPSNMTTFLKSGGGGAETPQQCTQETIPVDLDLIFHRQSIEIKTISKYYKPCFHQNIIRPIHRKHGQALHSCL